MGVKPQRCGRPKYRILNLGWIYSVKVYPTGTTGEKVSYKRFTGEDGYEFACDLLW